MLGVSEDSSSSSGGGGSGQKLPVRSGQVEVSAGQVKGLLSQSSLMRVRLVKLIIAPMGQLTLCPNHLVPH